MELLEYIYTLNQDTYIKVGANKGNGFIFCGKAGDFKKYMDDEDVSERERYKIVNTIEQKKDYIADFDNLLDKETLRNIAKFMRAKAEGDKFKKFKAFKTLADYEKHLEILRTKRWDSLHELLKVYENRLQDFTPIETRDVVETYDSVLLNEDGQIDHIIIYAGFEASIYWDLTEFRHGVQKEDLPGYPTE